jgi:hypothetical protein
MDIHTYTRDAQLVAAVAGLDLADQAAVDADFLDDDAAGRAPVPELVAAWRDEAEMLAENEALASEWIRDFLEGAENDLYQQESDAAAEQERLAEMKAAFEGAPPLFQAMLAKVMTDEEFSQIRDWVCKALFANWPLLCQIHEEIFDASQPKYRRLRNISDATTSTHHSCVKVACGKCPAMISKAKVDQHRANCKGPTTIDVFMYFLACLLGIERAIPAVVSASRKTNYSPMTNFLSTFVPGYQNGVHFVPQDTITNDAFKTWLTELYGAGCQEPVALDREVQRLRRDDGLSDKALQHAIQEYVAQDDRVILQNIHDEPGFWAAVRPANIHATVSVSAVSICHCHSLLPPLLLLAAQSQWQPC